MRKRIITNEEKEAKKLAELLSDLRLDLELVGVYFAQNVGSTLYNRLQIVYETAQEIKEEQNERTGDRQHQRLEVCRRLCHCRRHRLHIVRRQLGIRPADEPQHHRDHRANLRRQFLKHFNFTPFPLFVNQYQPAPHDRHSTVDTKP